jgi:hypothetical protein
VDVLCRGGKPHRGRRIVLKIDRIIIIIMRHGIIVIAGYDVPENSPSTPLTHPWHIFRQAELETS